MCQTPELASEVTLQPLRRAPLDAVIIFCDILIIPQALGMECLMVPGKGPVFPKPLAEPAMLAELNLAPSADTEFDYLFQAITMTVKKMEHQVPLIGFCGAPWTLMAYMVEGGGSKTWSKAKTWLYRNPTESHKLLAAIAALAVDLLVGQWRAGASLLQVFESGGGELPPALFNQFALPYLKRIVDGVRARVPPVAEGGPPVTVFARNAHFALGALCETQYDVIGLDWATPPAAAVKAVAGRKVLQGNMDPCVLYAPPADIVCHTRTMLDEFAGAAADGKLRGLIVNLGHGMLPDMQPEHFCTFIHAAQDESKAIIAAGAEGSC
jgi:uroporphyrinogen decarboxylase